MFKPGRWRSDKNKIKAVFRLQFHATQVSLLGGDSLMLSVVPTDVGKPTARLEKVKVQDGSCYWEKPVNETIKFTREPKTGKINERSYRFIIATGLSNFGFLGEVSMDFANYAEATKLSSVSLPLKNMKFEAVLHVSIERILDSADQSYCKEIEDGENVKDNSQVQSLRAQLSNSDMDGNIKTNFTEEGSFNKIVSQVVELNGNCRASSGSDVTISSSESSSGLDTPREIGMKNNNINEDRNNFLSSLGHASVPQKPTFDATTAIYEEHQGSQSEWSGGSVPDVSTDDSSSSPCETLTSERSEDSSIILIEKLKSELAVLARQLEVSELEIQTLRKNVMKESKRGQDLSRELISVKEERDAFREECEKLKGLQKRSDEAKVQNKLQFDGGDPLALVEELRQELNHEKDLNANIRLQLQRTQESNSELILAVQDLDEMLEVKNREILDLSKKSATSDNVWETNSKCDIDMDEDQKALEELVKEHSDAKDAYVLEQKIMDVDGEIEIYRRDRDDLEMQMEQLALDYEILKQENHDISYKLAQSQLQEQLKMQYECSTSYATLNELETQIESMENELKKQSKEFSDSLITISDLENHVKSLEEELEKQAQGFEADLEDLMRSKVEQEQRAIRAEETLRKTRLQNAMMAERLQEEFTRLSFQMASSFDANEKIATKALTGANELRLEKNYLEEMFQQAKEELQSVRDLYEAKLVDVSSQIHSKVNQMEQMQSEVEYKSIEIENQRKLAEETHRILSEEIQFLQCEIGRLTAENNVFSEQAEQKVTLRVELEQMKGSIKGTELLVDRGITERNELEKMIMLLKIDAEKSLKEMNIMRSLKDEVESIAGSLQSELEILKTQYDELKHSLLEDQLENEKLRIQVIQLKGDLKKKENALSNLHKKMKDNNGRAPVSEAAKAKNNKSVPAPRGSKEFVNLKEKIRLLEGQMKLKEAALETTSNISLEKEKNLQSKIEELERSLEILNQNAASFCNYKFQQVTGDTENLALSDGITEEAMFTAEDLSTKECTSDKMGCPLTCTQSNNDISSENVLKDSAKDSKDQVNLGELLNEMELLKERNQLMESELKDMRERYSDISLKFAEVEGERQQLVMTLRNVKNSMKCYPPVP